MSVISFIRSVFKFHIGCALGPSTPSNTTSTNITTPWAGQQPYLSQGFSNAQNWLNNGGTQVAGFNPTQTQAQQGITNLAQSGANGLQQNSTASLNSFMNGSMLNSNPYLNNMANAADNSIIRNYSNAVAPGISSNFEANGRYGSGSMSNAQSQAQQDLATQLGNTNSQIYGNAYQQGMSNMLQANALAPQTANLGLGLLNAQNQVGSQQQQLQQQINSQPLTNLKDYMGLVGGAQYGGSSSQQTPYFTNPTANAAGDVMAMYALYSMFSDRRLKRDIKRVGTLNNGLPVYTYKYKGSPTIHMGVMADEVKKVRPGAVHNVGGYDMVNYGEVA